MTRRNINLLIGFIVGVVLIVILGILLANRTGNVEEAIDSVAIEKDGGKLVVSSDGSVVFTNSEGVFFDQWDNDKTSTFFKYFGDNYQGDSQLVSKAQNSVVITRGGTNYTYILNDDEIADAGGEDAQEQDDNTGGSGGNGGSGGSGGSGGVSTGTPRPTSSSSGGSGGGVSGECLYWKLSYCVIARTPSPSSAPTGTPDPDGNVIEAANCGEYLAENQTPTIINNTLCIPEPSPLP